MFTITDQAFMAMAPIKTYSHISNDITKDLNHNHLYQISMDDPNINI